VLGYRDFQFSIIRFSGGKKGNFLVEMKIDELRMEKMGWEEQRLGEGGGVVVWEEDCEL
jgi:hypothetical protein